MQVAPSAAQCCRPVIICYGFVGFSTIYNIVGHLAISGGQIALAEFHVSTDSICQIIIHVPVSNEIIEPAGSQIYSPDIPCQVSSLEFSCTVSEFVLAFKALTPRAIAIAKTKYFFIGDSSQILFLSRQFLLFSPSLA